MKKTKKDKLLKRMESLEGTDFWEFYDYWFGVAKAWEDIADSINSNFVENEEIDEALEWLDKKIKK